MPAPTLIVGAPCWIDLYSSDTARATAFYESVFGWVAQPPVEGVGGYFTFTKDGKHIAGCMANDGGQARPAGRMKGFGRLLPGRRRRRNARGDHGQRRLDPRARRGHAPRTARVGR